MKIKTDLYLNGGVVPTGLSTSDLTEYAALSPSEGTLLFNETTKKWVFFDGTSFTPIDTKVDLLDEDDMSSNDATKAPSQQSVKAYVDALDEALSPVVVALNASSGNEVTVSATSGKYYYLNGSSGCNVKLPPGVPPNENFFMTVDATGATGTDRLSIAAASNNIIFKGQSGNTSVTMTKGSIYNVISPAGNSNWYISPLDTTPIVDEDDFASNSESKVPTQQSVKAYVDGKVASGTSSEASVADQAVSADLDLEANPSNPTKDAITLSNPTDSDKTLTNVNGGTFTLEPGQKVTVYKVGDKWYTLDSALNNLDDKIDDLLLDEDDMVSDSATKGATQQSIKAYVDSKSTSAATSVATTNLPAVGAENSLGLNKDDDTLQEVIDKLGAYVEGTPRVLTSVVLVDSNNLSDSQAKLASVTEDDLLFEWDTDGTTTYAAVPLDKFTDSGAFSAASITNGVLKLTSIGGVETTVDLGTALDASGFNGNLETTDNTLQKVAQKLDDLTFTSSKNVTSSFTPSDFVQDTDGKTYTYTYTNAEVSLAKLLDIKVLEGNELVHGKLVVDGTSVKLTVSKYPDARFTGSLNIQLKDN